MSKDRDGTNQNVRVWWRDKFKCAYCDLDMSSGRNSELLVTDHIDPRTKIKYPPGDFSKDHDSEKTTACIPCNTFKHGFRPPEHASREDKIQAARKHVRKEREYYSKWIGEVTSKQQRDDWFSRWNEIRKGAN